MPNDPSANEPEFMARLREALALQQQGRLDEAEPIYRAVLSEAPDHFDALHLLGLIHYQRGQFAEAIPLFDRAIQIGPHDLYPHYNRALALDALKRPAEALLGWERVIQIKPDYAEAHLNRGNVLAQLKRYEEALPCFDRALRLKPDLMLALHNRGVALIELQRLNEALQCWDRILRSDPQNKAAHGNRAVTLQKLNRADEALLSYQRAIALDPDDAQTYVNRGIYLGTRLERYAEAAQDFDDVLRMAPQHEFVRGHRLHMRMLCCDWRDFDRDVETIQSGVREGRRVCWPFVFQAISQSPADLKICAETNAADYPIGEPQWRGERHRPGKIRLGYVGGEFRTQATSLLAAGLYEAHDRERFEVYAFDNGFDDSTPLRKRVKAAFDRFIDISGQSDQAAAKLIRDCEIDVLINLNGWFGLERTRVFAARPSPIQVNYLGFPGTLGAPFMDYIIADRIVIPEEERVHFTEQVVYLPDTYQVNDPKRAVSPLTPTRAAAKLPERGFVFASFNNGYKYTPEMFDIWMRLLRNVEDSVLWLFQHNPMVVPNLRREAEARGVSGARLVFAPFVQPDEHLARLMLADLYLDNLPYNAHTGASDALWVGLPIVTCTGTAFAGRVATSLLRAIDAPELITQSLADYEALALKLARDPVALAAAKRKLAENKLSTPLFDLDRYRRHLESAFLTMWERHERGEPPQGFAVPAV